MLQRGVIPFEMSRELSQANVVPKHISIILDELRQLRNATIHGKKDYRKMITPEIVSRTKLVANALEPVCKIGKEKNGSNGDHGSEIGSSFFIAGCNTTELVETIDESFNNISLSVMLLVERTSALFIAAPSNGATNMVTMEIIAKGAAGVAFISHQTPRS